MPPAATDVVDIVDLIPGKLRAGCPHRQPVGSAVGGNSMLGAAVPAIQVWVVCGGKALRLRPWREQILGAVKPWTMN